MLFYRTIFLLLLFVAPGLLEEDNADVFLLKELRKVNHAKVLLPGVLNSFLGEIATTGRFPDSFYQRQVLKVLRVYSTIDVNLFNTHASRTREEMLLIYLEKESLQVSTAYLPFINKEKWNECPYKDSILLLSSASKELQLSKTLLIVLTKTRNGFVHEPAPVFGASGRLYQRTKLPLPTLLDIGLNLFEWITLAKRTLVAGLKKNWLNRENKLVVLNVLEIIKDLDNQHESIKKVVEACQKRPDLVSIINFQSYSSVFALETEDADLSTLLDCKYVFLRGFNRVGFGAYARRMLYLGHTLLISKSQYSDQELLVFGMEEFVHYIPVWDSGKDLLLKVSWLQHHPEIAKRLAENAFWLAYGFTNLTSYKRYTMALLSEYSTRQNFVPNKLPDVFAVKA